VDRPGGRTGTEERKGLKALISKIEAEPERWRQKRFQVKNNLSLQVPAPICHQGLSK